MASTNGAIDQARELDPTLEFNADQLNSWLMEEILRPEIQKIRNLAPSNPEQALKVLSQITKITPLSKIPITFGRKFPVSNFAGPLRHAVAPSKPRRSARHWSRSLTGPLPSTRYTFLVVPSIVPCEASEMAQSSNCSVTFLSVITQGNSFQCPMHSGIWKPCVRERTLSQVKS
ncbi:hypothetical protein SBA6_410074 [Candidatus Sulfopaludibacter sp. SbA6]|nr:hypothetical protein SBA6_410074 [Candidatus Sulfopaludibacter sp. SbA6]